MIGSLLTVTWAEPLELAPDDLLADDRSCDLARQLAEELQLRYLDLREPFRAAALADPQHPLYFRFDHHLTPRGQSEIARLLRELWMSEHGESQAP